MNEQFLELELNTQLLYLKLLQQKQALLRSLIAMETRIEVFETAFNIEGEK
jgi:hypothetical protein